MRVLSRRLPTQCKQLIERILGCAELLEPEIDASEFIKQVRAAVGTMPLVYNPLTGKMAPWIDVSALQKHFRRVGGKTGGCVVA